MKQPESTATLDLMHAFIKADPDYSRSVKESLVNDVAFCIETVSGRLVNPSNPDVNSIDVHDIAWALSRIPRFAGHSITAQPFNVAQHSVYVSELLEDQSAFNQEALLKHPEAQIATAKMFPFDPGILMLALFHDAHEAYTGDIPSPIKKIPEIRGVLKEIETKLDKAIFSKYVYLDISKEEHAVVKHADKLAQAIEAYQFMPSRGRNWVLPKPSLTLLQNFPPPMSPIDSYKAFIDRYEYLKDQ